jgi:hypothetical protein
VKKSILFSIVLSFFNCLAEANPQQVDLFMRETAYIVTNNTQEPMDVTWQTGGGSGFDVLTGREGSFHLSPNTSPLNSHQIVASGTDTITWIVVTSSTFSEMTVRGENINRKNISIEYEGELKDRKLILK